MRINDFLRTGECTVGELGKLTIQYHRKQMVQFYYDSDGEIQMRDDARGVKWVGRVIFKPTDSLRRHIGMYT